MDEANRIFGRWLDGPIFVPWPTEPEFMRLYEVASGTTIVSPDRCYMLWCLARHCARIPGNFAECGVYQGGTAAFLASILKGSGRDLYLFDTFAGIPPGDPSKDNRYVKGGEFAATSVLGVSQFLLKNGLSAKLVPGLIPETLSAVKDASFSFVHVDVDIYWPAKHCLEFFYPRMAPGGVMLFDDYGFEECAGVWKAVREFSESHDAPHIPLPTGQALVIAHKGKEPK